MDPSLNKFLQDYAKRVNTHRFEDVAGMIAPDAVFWFNDGSYRGLVSIQSAFERTWQTIQDEHYSIDNIEWIAVDEQAAACIYSFNWSGRVNGKFVKGGGRGTSVLKKIEDRWYCVHEHLSPKV